MKNYTILFLVFIVFGARNSLFKPQFLSLSLQSDRYHDGKITYDDIDPPAGHGLPQFTAPIEDLTAAQLEKEINDWKMSEAAAEDEFFEQTDSAIADAKQEMKACEQIQDPVERAVCIEDAQDTIDGINDMVSDLQTEHAIEEEFFDAAMDEELVNKRIREAETAGPAYN